MNRNFKTRSFGRNSFRPQRPFTGRRRPYEKRLDVSKFINKAVITEAVEQFKPEHAFSDFAIHNHIKSNIAAKGYIAPTPIQDRAIPHILRGDDIVGIANTGTGKTGAFLIPLINKVAHDPSENILVVVPTRELAIQIDQELREFAAGMRLFSVCCVGGANIGRQISDLRRPHRFVIGTPGRIKDLMKRKMINLARFKTVVLDEADRMLDMGFIADIRFMLSQTPKERHTLFFSATLSQEIEGLIKEFLRNPVTISVKTRDTAKNVDQDVIKVQRGKDKIDLLHELLIQPEFSKVLIFGKTKHGVEKLSKLLAGRGFKVESIHGNKTHMNRQRALGSFKESRIKILVATDVAARGLDIDDVSHVINYDLPATYDDYVHRIGRTGRGSKKGKALTFVE
ncbi:MAG: DEAD/DEAH box helicase [Patescibacteria group bacterium]